MEHPPQRQRRQVNSRRVPEIPADPRLPVQEHPRGEHVPCRRPRYVSEAVHSRIPVGVHSRRTCPCGPAEIASESDGPTSTMDQRKLVCVELRRGIVVAGAKNYTHVFGEVCVLLLVDQDR